MGTDKQYFGVNYYKQCSKWRAIVIHDRKHHYIGLFDSQHVAAAAREAFLDEFPCFVRPRKTRRNKVQDRWRVEYDNQCRDPDASPVKVYAPLYGVETWIEMPGFPGYETSSRGRVRTSRTWGWVEVVQRDGTVVLVRDGRLCATRLPLPENLPQP